MRWKLSIIKGRNAGIEIPLEHFPFSIGRGSQCDLAESDSCISRKHCELIVHDDSLVVVDTASRNGVYVNGIRIVRQKELRPGDCIRIGVALYCLGTVDAPTVMEAFETVTTPSQSQPERCETYE